MTDAILLTAAVYPSPGIVAAVSDPRIRIAQYRVAIQEWLNISSAMRQDLIVVETTGATRSELLGGLQGEERSQFMTFEPTDSLIMKGKGAVEIAAIQAVIGERGEQQPGTSCITKVTGRLCVQNAKDILLPMPGNSFRVRRTLDRSYVDTRLLQGSLGAWQVVAEGLTELVDDARGRYVEHALALALVTAEFHAGLTVLRFPSRPQIRGVSGTSGTRYGGKYVGAREFLLKRAESYVQALSTKQI